MKTLRHLAPVGAALALLLTACGTTEDAVEPETDTTDAGLTAEALTVTDSRGEEVVLEDGPATDIVALEWNHAEMAATLGVMPVGVADVDGYTTWDAAVPLDDSVRDVGTRGEPSIDSIVDLEPDLILAEGDTDPAQITQLEQYAPVLVLQTTNAEDSIGTMTAAFETLAAATGTEDEAAAVLAEFDQTIADAKAAVEQAGATGSYFVMADGWLDGSNVAIRPFGQGSYMSDLAEAIGLVNAWEGEVDPMWGLGQTDVEGLATGIQGKDDLTFIYSASTDDVFTTGLVDNPIWAALPFVQAGDIVKLEPGTWTFGGPRSGQSIVQQFADAVTS
jgi:ferric hydroxamate transport system substrate-binding protein